MSDIITIVVISVVALVLIFICCCFCCYIYDKKAKKKDFTLVSTFDDNPEIVSSNSKPDEEIEMTVFPRKAVVKDVTEENSTKKMRVPWQENVMVENESSYGSEVPKGLTNLKNTCYLNALLQCLCWTPDFTARLKKQIDLGIHQQNSITCSLHNVLECMQEDNGNTSRHQVMRQKLRHLIKLTTAKYTQFEYGKQHDIFELYNTFCGEISDDIEKYGKEDKCQDISGMFTGELAHSFHYVGHCEHVDTNAQVFTSICVPVELRKIESRKRKWESDCNYEESTMNLKRDEHKYSIDERHNSISHNTGSQHPNAPTTSIQSQAPVRLTDIEIGIKNFFRTESFPVISCRNPNCKQGTGCERKSSMSSVPRVLVLLINKLKQTGRTLEKVHGKISFPDTLDLKKLQVLGENVKDKGLYDLYAVACHIGNVEGGHYYAYIRVCDNKVKEGWTKKDKEHIFDNRKDKTDLCYKKADKPPVWYCADDTIITSVKDAIVTNDENAYMLFFIKKNEGKKRTTTV